MEYYNKFVEVEAIVIKETEKAVLLNFDGREEWIPKSLIQNINFENRAIQKTNIMEFIIVQKGLKGVVSKIGLNTISTINLKGVQKVKQTVNLVYNEEGIFYDVFPKTTKSITIMRNKILGIQNVKWQWHVILTYKPILKKNILINGGMSGSELLGFLRRTKTIVDENRKYFWKYEEGSNGGKPHFHLLFDFGGIVNKALIAKKIYKKKWEEGEIDIKKKIDRQKKYKMNYNKSDEEILMGILLYRKWDKRGIVYAKKIKGMGKKHRYDLIYYINKDLMKPSTYNCLKQGASKWGFGKGYKFENVDAFSSSQYVSVNYAIHKMMTTKQKFIEYYDSLGKDGYRLFFRKIRYMKQGKYFDVIK